MPPKYESVSLRSCRCCCKWRCRCLVPRSRRPHPPFNSGVRTECKLGLHPDTRALPPTSPAVGTYDPRTERELKAVSWKREKEAEEFSATRGGRMSEEVMFQRDLMRAGRGPGAHEVPRWPECDLSALCRSRKDDIGFGSVPRFKPTCRSTTPGPGYTLKVHDPHYYLDQKRLKGFSRIPSFEFDGLVSRSREIRHSWSLPCNKYNVKHPDSLQARLEKVTGKRGPYDLLTGPRDETTIRGYWAPAKLKCYADWPKKLPGEIEKLLSKSNYFKGRWSTNPRFSKKPTSRMMLQDVCYKDPNEPGPGHYHPQSPRKPSTVKKYPFGSSVECARPLSPRYIRPAPGRYNVKPNFSVQGHGWTCIFKSSVPRTFGVVIPPPYSDF